MKRDRLPSPPAPLPTNTPYDALLARLALPGRSLLTVLHAIQDDLGFIPKDIIAPLARRMGLSRAEVFGVVSYYHHFRDQAPARVRIALCRAEACRSMGSEALVEHAQRVTGCAIDAHRHVQDRHQANAQDGDGGWGGGEAHSDVSLQSVYCLGMCAQSPSMMIGARVYARVDAVRFDALLHRATVQESV